jgi:hypothetical protein
MRSVWSSVEPLCRTRGLLMGLKGSSSEYPGSIYRHFKKERENGTLIRTDFLSGEMPFVVCGSSWMKGSLDRRDASGT